MRKPNETKNAWKKKTCIKRHSYRRNTRVTVKERRWFQGGSSLNRQEWRRCGTATRGRRLYRGAVSVSKRPPAFSFSYTPKTPPSTPDSAETQLVHKRRWIFYRYLPGRPFARPREPATAPGDIRTCIVIVRRPECPPGKRVGPVEISCRERALFTGKKEKCLRKQCRGRKQRRWTPR